MESITTPSDFQLAIRPG